MQQVGVDGERRFALLVFRNRDLVLFSEFEQMRAALERPVAPWGDDLDVRVQRIGRKLETNPVVALAGRAVRDCVGAGLPAISIRCLEISGRAIEVPSR